LSFFSPGKHEVLEVSEIYSKSKEDKPTTTGHYIKCRLDYLGIVISL